MYILIVAAFVVISIRLYADYSVPVASNSENDVIVITASDDEHLPYIENPYMENYEREFDARKIPEEAPFEYNPVCTLKVWSEKDQKYIKADYGIACNDCSSGQGGIETGPDDNGVCDCTWRNTDFGNDDFRYDSYFKAYFEYDNGKETYTEDIKDDVVVLTEHKGSDDDYWSDDFDLFKEKEPEELEPSQNTQ